MFNTLDTAFAVAQIAPAAAVAGPRLGAALKNALRLAKRRSTTTLSKASFKADAARIAAGALIKRHGSLAAAVAAVKKMVPKRVSIYEPMFLHKAAAPPPKPKTAAPPTPVPAARLAERQNRHVDPNDPAAVHADQLRQTRAAHDDLLASIRAVHAAGPGLHPTGAPK